MTVDYLHLLYDYHYWANRRMWSCIADLSQEQFVLPLDYSVGSIRNQVVHMMSWEMIWFLRIQGTSPTQLLNTDEFPTPDAIQAAWRDFETKHRAFLNTMTDERLAQQFDYLSRQGVPYTDKIGNILFHVVNHATDHRAQIFAMLHSAFGVQTIEQDLFYYLREQQ